METRWFYNVLKGAYFMSMAAILAIWGPQRLQNGPHNVLKGAYFMSMAVIWAIWASLWSPDRPQRLQNGPLKQLISSYFLLSSSCAFDYGRLLGFRGPARHPRSSKSENLVFYEAWPHG